MTVELTVAAIGVIGTVLGAVAGAILTYRLATRGVSDKEQFLKWQVAFNRSAFRGSFQMRSGSLPFADAMDDTIQAVRTGLLVASSRMEVRGQRGKGMTDLKDKSLKTRMFEVVGLLEKIRQRVRDQLANQPLGADFVTEIDRDRDAVIRMMNAMWKQLGIDPLPLPTEVGDYNRVFGE